MGTQPSASLWRFSNAEFDEIRWELRVAGTLIEIEPRPLEVLRLLLHRAGEVVSKDEALDAVYGHRHISESTLSNAIGKLRKALGDDNQEIIATVHRIGYRLVGTVRRSRVPGFGGGPLKLAAGDAVPRREHWRLLRALGSGRDVEVWLAVHSKTREQRVYKFSSDGLRLSSLKREVTLFRVLTHKLGARRDWVRVIDWNFDESPYFVAARCRLTGFKPLCAFRAD